MKKILSFFYGLNATAELNASYARIHARRLAQRRFRQDYLNRPRLSDRENLEHDLGRIGGDFEKAIGMVCNGQ